MRKNKKTALAGKKRVFVMMSGGVDSSAAAFLLTNSGYDVFGVFFNLGQKNCASSVRDIRKAALKIGIPLKIIDLRKQFKKEVVDYFLKGYKHGVTPNPCVKCNKYVKFGVFLKWAKKQGTDYIATGHYVRLAFSVERLGYGKNKSLNAKRYTLYAARDSAKDQSYFLWMLNQNQLKYCLFPLGEYTKQEVRKIAEKAGLAAASEKESQDICFLQNADSRGSNAGLRGRGGDLHGFLQKNIRSQKGKILNTNGEIVGEHKGVAFYTVGQRKGLNIAAEKPRYVVKIDAERNILIVGDKKDCYVSEFLVKNVNWICEKPKNCSSVFVKIRSQQKLNSAKIVFFRKVLIKIKTKKPILAPAPGQSAVFYLKNGEMLGGGIII